MKLRIAQLPGDGIGPEVVAQAAKAIDAVCARFGHEVEYRYASVGACAIDRYGDAFPEETYRICLESDAVSSERSATPAATTMTPQPGSGRSRVCSRCARSSGSTQT